MRGVLFSEISVNSEHLGFFMTFCIHFGRLLECFSRLFGQNGAPEGVWEGKFDKIGRKKNRFKKTLKNGGLLRVMVAVLVGPG